MSPWELGLCLASLACSSASQLFMKSAVLSEIWARRVGRLAIAGFLLVISVCLAVLAMQTLPLSQLLPFAAGAHLLVPLGSSYFFHERLRVRFWIGALLIVAGILCTQT